MWQKCVEYKIQQKKEEFCGLIDYLKNNLSSFKNCLEIGCNTAGTTYGFSTIFEKVISVDIQKYVTWDKLCGERKNIEFWVNDSHSKDFADKLKSLNRQFEFIMIDGDHSAEGALADYFTALPYLAPGGIIAFHDILDTEFHRKYKCHVANTWNYLRTQNVNNLFTEIVFKENNPGRYVFGIMSDYSTWGGIGIIKFPPHYRMETSGNISLPNVTLIIIDCVDADRALKALRISMDKVKFREVKFLTSLTVTLPDGIDIVKIPEIKSKREYSVFIMKELWKYFNTSHCLIIQYDGYILNPGAWSEKFMDYDYIGAPWWFHKDRNVGNGGFSLRSKNIMEFVAKSLPESDWEDVSICRENYTKIVNNGFKFAPMELAEKFSIENGEWNGQFGFHNLELTRLNKFHYGKAAMLYGNVGDVIYSIPTLKKLDIQKIVLNPDNRLKQTIYSMGQVQCWMLQSLLEKQGFDVEVAREYQGAIVIDKWRDNLRELGKLSIAHLIAKTFNVSIDMNKPFLKVKQLHVYDVVVNRTPRYNNPSLDYRALLTGVRAAFIGLKSEWETFKTNFGINIDYYPTVNYYHAAQVIAGAKVFIGNASSCYAIAEGLKINRIQETSIKEPFCKGTIKAVNVSEPAHMEAAMNFLASSLI